MLSTEPNLPLENDILPTQNIGLLENQSQPQVYSLLPNSNGPLTTKRPRRKRTTKIDKTLPVTINPSITRISTGFACPTSYQYPTTNHRMPCRVYLRSNSHDANNNIQQNSIGRYPIPLNSTLSSQILPKNSSPIVNLTSQLFEVNHLPSNNPNERTTPIPISYKNESMRYNSSLTIVDQSLHNNSSYSILSAKPKRKYVKRQQASVSSYPVTLVQPSISNGLPSIIPVTLSGEHSRLISMPTANFLPLSPPSSIKSSPTNIISDSSIQTRSESTHYSSVQKLITDTNLRHFPTSLTVAHPQYCMVPADFLSKGILSMACPSTTSLESNLVDTQSPFAQLKSNGESLHSRLVTQNTSAVKKRKAKILNAKDIQTKMQLRRMIRRNRRAVFKFMMHKQKQQKQKIAAASTTTETIVEQTPTDNTTVTETIKPILPDIIAPNLKITFDARQKIESISLVYHRRRKPECKHENPWKVSSVDNNHLDLLIEAMELVETFRDHSNLQVQTDT